MRSSDGGIGILATSEETNAAHAARKALHNVSTVMETVHDAAATIREKLQNSSVAKLTKTVSLMQAHKADLAHYLTEDDKGRELPSNLCSLAIHLAEEQAEILQKLACMASEIEYLKQIVRN